MSESGAEILHVRCVLEGDVVRMYRELESRGLVKSVREAVTQGLASFYEKVMERDLLEARARASLRRANEL